MTRTFEEAAEIVAAESEEVAAVTAEEEAVPVEEIPEELTAALEPLEIGDEIDVEEPVEEEEAEEGEEPVAEELIIPAQMFAPSPEDDGRPQLRFAEDILPARRGRTGSKSEKSKRKRKGSNVKDTSEDGIKVKKGQKDYTIVEDEDYL